MLNLALLAGAPKAPTKNHRKRDTRLPKGTDIYPRPGSRFWWLKYRKVGDKKYTRVASGTDDYEKAWEVLRAQLALYDVFSCEYFMDRFLREGTQKESTKRGYRLSWRLWRPFVGAVHARELTHEHLRAFRSERGQQVSAATVLLDLAALSAMLTFAQECPGGPATNVAKTFPKRSLRRAKPRVRWLEPDEVTSLMRELGEPYQRLIVLLAAEAGLRKTEALRLHVRQADPERGVIVLGSGDTKTGRGRGVPMTDALRKEIIGWLEANPGLRPGDWLMAAPRTGLPYVGVGKWWAAALARAGITDFRFHDLRHHFASTYVNKGGRLQALAKLLGHTTTQMTEKYAHLQSAAVADEFRKIMGGSGDS